MNEIKGNIRQQLHGFYIAYDLWLKNGAGPGGVFSQSYGLCANIFDYLTSIGVPCEAALEQLHIDFISAGLNEALPFNESKEHYHEERRRNECHMNPARVAWVREQAARALPEAEPVAYIFRHPAGKLFWSLTDESNKEQPDVMPVYAALPATNAGCRQVNELTVWVKRLAHSLKHANSLSSLSDKAIAYLEQSGLISPEEVLR